MRANKRMKESPDTIIPGHCNTCLRETDHHLLREYKDEWEDVVGGDPGFSHHGREDYEILKCCGCGSIIIRHKSWVDGYCDDQGRSIPIDTSYYPPAVSRKPPEWLDGLDWMFRDQHFVPRLLKQVYTAMFNQCEGLAAMGIRALLEQVMIDKGGEDLGTFSANMKQFQEAGFVGEVQVKQLAKTLDLGHAVMHRDFIPKAKEISIALDITEAILATCYEYDERSEEMSARIPPRN